MSIDHEGLHLLLWLRRSSAGTVQVRQTQLAKELGCSRYQLSRTLHAMAEEGRLRNLTTKGGPTPNTYEVMPPAGEVEEPAVTQLV